MMVVNDASKDPRFDGNPLVHSEGGLRFYAGALLKRLGDSQSVRSAFLIPSPATSMPIRYAR